MRKMIPRFELDRAAWYRLIRWCVKWTIVMAMLMLVWSYALESADAEEARLVRIEARLDSLDNRADRIALAMLSLVHAADDSVHTEIVRQLDSVKAAAVESEPAPSTEDTLISVFGQHLIIRSMP